jgi:hypothetical protein
MYFFLDGDQAVVSRSSETPGLFGSSDSGLFEKRAIEGLHWMHNYTISQKGGNFKKSIQFEKCSET